MTTELWKPDLTLLDQCTSILQALRDPTRTDHTSAMRTLTVEVSNPSFILHVLHLFSRGYSKDDQLLAADLRQLGGFVIKNYALCHLRELSLDVQRIIKGEILNALCDGINEIGRISELLPASSWVDMITPIVTQLDSNNLAFVDGALAAVVHLCEDSSEKLADESSVRPLDLLVPRLVRTMAHAEPSFRLRALISLNSLLFLLPMNLGSAGDSFPGTQKQCSSDVLFLHMPQYLQALSALSSDPTRAIRRAVCQALVLLAGLQFDVLQPAIGSICQFMLTSVLDADHDVAIEACEFWAALAACDQGRDIVRGSLPALIPNILTRMVYTEEQIAQERADEEAQASGEKKVNLKPVHHKVVGRGKGDDGDGDGEDSFVWTLRKQSALVLDKLAVDFEAELVLAAALPSVHARLQNEDVWVRESALLALGALANGCRDEMGNHLSDLLPFLLGMTSDGVSEVRSIACWVLSRYSPWIFEGAEDDTPGPGAAFLSPLLESLLRVGMDPLPKVQSAACSALCVLIDEGRSLISPYVTPVLQYMRSAFDLYGLKNQLVLCDALGTLAESLGGDLADPSLTAMFLPPVMAKLADTEDYCDHLFPILECLSSIIIAIGVEFQSYAVETARRALGLLEGAIRSNLSDSLPEDRINLDFAVCALDLFSALVEGLRENFMQLLLALSSASNANCTHKLLELVLHSTASPLPDLRQSAFALLGEGFKSCPPLFPPVLGDVMKEAIGNLDLSESLVCNNVVWMTGEALGQYGMDALQYVQPVVLSAIVGIVLSDDEMVPISLRQNVAIALGRAATVQPDVLLPFAEDCLVPWLRSLKLVQSPIERLHAYKGLVATLHCDPKLLMTAGAAEEFVLCCYCWEPSDDGSQSSDPEELALVVSLREILLAVRGISVSTWDSLLAQLDVDQRDQFLTVFQLPAN